MGLRGARKVTHKLGCRTKLSGFGVVLGGLVLLSQAEANRPLVLNVLDIAQPTIVSPVSTQLEVLRPVNYFFSAEAWGGLPFSDEQMQQVMVRAMLEHALVRMELPVTHLLDAPNAHVRAFTAVYEIDGRGDTPSLRAGYELELLVPRSGSPLIIELINGDTGITNRVEVTPDGSL